MLKKTFLMLFVLYSHFLFLITNLKHLLVSSVNGFINPMKIILGSLN